ncbi:uncharacterized protein LOC142483330 isoform X2 [Ascaphus truei]|uniref:uncharacterized protein LOC142483330 isoform X2 n=1 Tax=Ascaphus truei TaxID=8439 RepID=UPI003F5A000B
MARPSYRSSTHAEASRQHRVLKYPTDDVKIEVKENQSSDQKVSNPSQLRHCLSPSVSHPRDPGTLRVNSGHRLEFRRTTPHSFHRCKEFFKDEIEENIQLYIFEAVAEKGLMQVEPAARAWDGEHCRNETQRCAGQSPSLCEGRGPQLESLSSP